MSATKTRTKTCRIEARLDEDTASLIASGATLVNESVSEFVTEAARARAEQLVGRADRTLMPAAQFDTMIEALDGPARAIPELLPVFSAPDRIQIR